MRGHEPRCRDESAMWICQNCAVEHAEATGVCAICADERQWMPADGQHWTTREDLERAGHRARVEEIEPDLYGITVEPAVGIGQRAHLVRTPAGNLLWDPTGYLDADGVARVREPGVVAANRGFASGSLPWPMGIASRPSRGRICCAMPLGAGCALRCWRSATTRWGSGARYGRCSRHLGAALLVPQKP